MHHLQLKLLHALTLTDKARFSQLKPKTIESNLFIYHLKRTMAEKLVIKNRDGTYSLSRAGQAYADKVSLGSFKLRSQPKIVNLLACTNTQGQWLLYRRKHQPFIGRSGFPYGKIHLGETIKQSSERELKEKTNLSTKLAHRGDVYVSVFDGETLISHTLFHVHRGYNPSGNLKEETSIGFCYWSDVDESASKEYFPGFLEIYAKLKHSNRQRFFDEYEFKL